MPTQIRRAVLACTALACAPPLDLGTSERALTTLPRATVPASGAVIDCGGEPFVPVAPGREWQNDGHPSVPSTPAAAFLVAEVSNVTIRNCVLDGFDFGVVVARADHVKIEGCTLTSLYQGISVVGSSDVEIAGNTIATRSRGSVGITVIGDSARVHIHNNVIRGVGTGQPSPAPHFAGGPDTKDVLFSDGILFTQPDLPAGAPFEVVVGDRRVRFTNDPDHPSDSIVEDNQIETFLFTNWKGAFGIGINELQDGVVVRRNTIRAPVGVFVGTLFHRLDATREFWPRNVRIEENQIVESLYYGLNVRDVIAPIVRRNFVARYKGTGIKVARGALESAVVTRNVFVGDGSLRAMSLDMGADIEPTFFGAHIYLNDFLGRNRYTVQVEAEPYTYVSDLSYLGHGNHWGRPCSDSGGFREAGVRQADSPLENILDGHPYGRPVADTPDGASPSHLPCE